MTALSGKCCVGDQLPPRGELCEHTYNLIGSVYSHIEACEPYCEAAKRVCDIGVITPEAFTDVPVNQNISEQMPPSAIGAARLLQELHQQFDMIDPTADFSAYKLIILPDSIPVNLELSDKLSEFINNGGAMILSHRAGLRPDTEEFAIDIGAEYDGPCRYEPSFVTPKPKFYTGLPDTEHVMYKRGSMLEALEDGTEILAEQTAPYFNRTWKHYFSHRHAPSSGKSLGAAVVQKGRIIYFTHPIFEQFHDNAPAWVRDMTGAALARVLPEPAVKLENTPTTLTAALNTQPGSGRKILHLLHAVPTPNAASAPTISDEIPVYDVEVAVKSEGNIKAVTQQPEGDKLQFKIEGNYLRFTVPRVGIHTMAVIEKGDSHSSLRM